MNLLFWGLTISVVGKILLAVGVLKAHSEIVHEHKIDLKVLKSFKLERWLTIAGILLILVGYIMEIRFYEFTPFLTCSGAECTASLNSGFNK